MKSPFLKLLLTILWDKNLLSDLDNGTTEFNKKVIVFYL
ncbi:hypothetical protein DFQ02_109118 [Seonamhaeicola aphaedonensis]|uniref:Uncharacterized protein n=1 Tax=Seonamhaeicola aphaedonensis TaxID=1461338 RepID=A0A3D9H769_9FLAO|nr:hypothetical protein DFQ02_109118 [Seonamhaeicola aphaedonensis]